MSKKKEKHPAKKTRACDPAVCDECQYIGEGDFVCMKGDPVLVIDEWVPTDQYLRCTENM